MINPNRVRKALEALRQAQTELEAAHLPTINGRGQRPCQSRCALHPVGDQCVVFPDGRNLDRQQ
jgi:hypothetical protein